MEGRMCGRAENGNADSVESVRRNLTLCPVMFILIAVRFEAVPLGVHFPI